MSLLLQFGGTEVVNDSDNTGLLPLHYACTVQCVKTVQLLLQADSALISTGVHGCPDRGDVLKHALASDADTLIPYLIPALVDRRNRLQQLAFERLPKDIYDHLHLRRDRILDRQAYRTLVENDEMVPDSLRCSNGVKTVYHSQSLTPEISDLLFEAGFRDTDGLDSKRITPLMGCGTYNLMREESTLYNLPWLLSKDAEIYRNLPSLKAEESEGKIIHQLAYHLGANFRRHRIPYLYLSNSLHDRDAVVSRFRRYPDELRCLLADIFSSLCLMDASVSVRMGDALPRPKFSKALQVMAATRPATRAATRATCGCATGL
jgi:hypothetical protein